MTRRVFGMTSLLGASLGAALLLGGYSALFSVSHKDWTEKKILIPEGATFQDAAHLLRQEGAISREWGFIFLGKLTLTERKIHAGEYLLNSRMNTLDILRHFRDGKVLNHRVVVREGATLREIGKILEAEGLAYYESFENLTHDPDFVASLGVQGESLEGYLYPDTYFLFKGQRLENILRGMVSRFQMVYTAEMDARAQEMGMTRKEVVTLASIIEKEAVVPQDRSLISAVFHNRMRKGIPLQSDPTVIYALGERFNGDLKRVHLRIQSPYNTYNRRGLPPGPIASPALPSLRAALYPADEDIYYFVSRNDGTHHFSKTIKEHNKAVLLYQKPKKSSSASRG
ncbi:MAG: endolytic transglycosylase MltG [Nitrospirae bacterium]|nr:endolytic transglycosylase MltG [Nitrospirota bacterium]